MLTSTEARSSGLSSRPPRTGRHARRNGRGRLVVVIATPLLILMIATLWLAVQVVTAVRELGAAHSGIVQIRAVLEAVRADPGRLYAVSGAPLQGRLDSLAGHTARAHAATDGPLWAAAGHIPLVGANFVVVADLARSGDTLVHGPAHELVSSLHRLGRAPGGQVQGLEPGKGDGRGSASGAGASPLALIEQLAPTLRRAQAQSAEALSELRSSAGQPLLRPVADARAEAMSGLSSLDGTLRPAAAAAAVAGPMLGATTPRTYFVAFVNPAEARGGGGLLAGFAVVRAEHGTVSVRRIGSDADLPSLERGPSGLPLDFQRNYADYGADTDWDESNLSAHFPYTALLWSKMYQKLTGTPVDAVLSLDPSALSALLAGAPPIQVMGTGVTAANVVDFIQRGEYTVPMSAEQRKDGLKRIAQEAVSRLKGSSTSALLRLLPRLGSAAAQGHIRLWSAAPAEEDVLAAHRLGGQIPALAGPFVSFSVNNAGSGKLDAYLATTTTYAVRTCTARRRSVDLSVVLDNRAPRSGLPRYVTVRGDALADDGSPRPVTGANRSLLQVLLTAGATVRSATLNGRPVGPGAGFGATPVTMSSERGHPLASLFVDTDPGGSATVVLHLDEPGSDSVPTLLEQPMAIPQVLRATSSCRGGFGPER